MRKLLKSFLTIGIIAAATFADVEINATNFPDDNFRNLILSKNYGDGNTILTNDEIAEITSIDVSSKNISDLTGIGNFTALTSLYCYSNQLTSLNVSTNTALKYLYCQNNLLPELSISTNTLLEYLECSDNQLTALNVSSNTALARLWCKNNQLNELNISSNTALRYLECYNNELTALNILSNTLLTSLDCHNNQLIELNLSENTALATLDCSNNKLTELDISNNVLTNLNCSYNYIPEAKLPAEPEVVVSWTTTPQYIVAINETTFPDDNFRAWALTKDWGSDSLISTSEVDTIKSISVNDKGISDLTGIEYFTELTYLSCSDNQLTSLNVSSNPALTHLNCSSNQLDSLDFSSNPALTYLSCSSNQLDSLDVSSNPALTQLYCDNNQLTSLDFSSNPALTYLNCSSNQLDSLDVSSNPALTRLYCQNNYIPKANVPAKPDGVSESYWVTLPQYVVAINETTFPDNNFRAWALAEDWGSDSLISTDEVDTITSIDVYNKSISSLKGIEYFTALTTLSCSDNQLDSLDVSSNTALTYLNCNSNQLDSLDVSSNTALTYLNCNSNQLTELNVSSNPALTYLSCSNNQLDSLDVSSNPALTDLGCDNNELTKLNLSVNTALINLQCHNNRLTFLDVSENAALRRLSCFFNQLDSLDFSSNPALISLDCRYNYIPEANVPTKPDGVSESYWLTLPQYVVAINETTFPDDNFRAWALSQTWGSDSILSTDEVEKITSINVNGNGKQDEKKISDLTGIEYFTALASLYCSFNQLTSLNVSTNTALGYLDCRSNQLTKLDVSANTELTDLNCYNNQLDSLDVSTNPALIYLYCVQNQLTSLNVSTNTALGYLDCRSNQLTKLDVSANTELTYLYCDNNQLTSLDFSSNPALKELSCYNNQLDSLDVSTNPALMVLLCYNNKLDSIDFSSNPALIWLDCQNNYIPKANVPTKPDGVSESYWVTLPQYVVAINETTFPDNNFRAWALAEDWGSDSLISTDEVDTITSINVNSYGEEDSEKISDLTGIEYFTALTILQCGSNQLTELDVSANIKLTELYCDDNRLDSLDVSSNTELTYLDCSKNLLTKLNVSSNIKLTSLNCYSNQLDSLNVSTNLVLITLYCQNNQLTSLDVSANAALTELFCQNNYIPKANVPVKPDLVNENHWVTLPQYVVAINETTFPDDNFRAWALGQYWGSDSLISTDEVSGITSINVSGYGEEDSKKISDLTGIEYFTELTRLQCPFSQLTELDVSANIKLTELSCQNNQLTSLNVSSNPALTYLFCFSNQLTSLDVSSNTALVYLFCYNNQLTSINVSSNPALTYLDCGINQLDSLDVSSNPALTYLDCGINQLDSLDVSANTELTSLYCSNNQLTELDVSSNPALTYLNCSYNQLTSLDVSSNPALISLFCNYNYIPEAKLPVNNVGAGTWITLPQYIVGMFMNGETKYHSDTITTASGTISKPADPAKTGYTFNGWYKEKALTNLWDFDTDVFTGITTLYASFTINTYTITWSVNGETAETDENVEYGTMPTFDGDTPTKTSPYKYIYTFSGWSPEVATVVGNQTYTAVFDSTIRKHTVTFECNGGSEVAPQSIEYEGKIAIPANPTKDGYSFVGWHEGDTLFDMESAITRHITLSAEWDEIVAINKPQKDSRFGIKFANNIVSTTAEISVILPNDERAVKTKIVIYDAIGNIVFVGAQRDVPASSFVWNLTNSAGRTVANGTYLVIAEVKGLNGMSYHYSAKLGVKR